MDYAQYAHSVYSCFDILLCVLTGCAGLVASISVTLSSVTSVILQFSFLVCVYNGELVC